MWDSRKPSPLVWGPIQNSGLADAETDDLAEVHRPPSAEGDANCVVEGGALAHVGALDSQVIEHGDILAAATRARKDGPLAHPGAGPRLSSGAW